MNSKDKYERVSLDRIFNLPRCEDKSEGRTYQVRKTSCGWSYRIIYPDGHAGIEHSGYYTEEAARAAARDDRDGKKEWHS